MICLVIKAKMTKVNHTRNTRACEEERNELHFISMIFIAVKI